MRKIAIVGANSYIARNVIYSLRINYSDVELHLYDKAEKHIDDVKNYCSIDVLDEKSIENIDFSCDVIFMFIGKTGTEAGFDDYTTFINVNECALLNLLKAYRKFDSKAKIIFPSTRLVYKGKDEILNEDSEKEFKTVYAINKYACEMYLKQYNNVYNINYCIFRICVPYGSLIPNASSYGTAEFMLKKARDGDNITLYGDGEVRRSIIHIKDLCEILIEGAFSEKCINDVYNIGGEDYSLKEMAELISKKYSVKIEYKPYPKIAQLIESGSTVFDDTKLQCIISMDFSGKFNNWVVTEIN